MTGYSPAIRLFTLLLLAGFAVLLLAACDDGNDDAAVDDTTAPVEQPTPADDAAEPDPTATPVPPPPTPEAEATPTPDPATDDNDDYEADRMSVRVYLVRDERLAVASRDIARTMEVATSSINELLTGTTGFEADIGMHSEIPEDTRLLGISLNNGHAIVDLSGDFESGGGSFSMQMRVAQIVFTMTQFDTVDSVQIRLDGEDVEAIGGEGIIVSEPMTRDDFEDQMPAIMLESPAPGAELSSPVRLQGTSNVFEATMQVEIVDNSGLIVFEHFLTATSGTGERGEFDATVEFDISREGFGSIILFEYSARDGSRINIVEIPVDFRFE